MNRALLALAVPIVALLLAACGGDDTTPAGTAAASTSPAAVTTAATATPGRTATVAASATAIAPAVRLQRVLADVGALTRPVAMLEVEPGWFVIALQEGRVVGFPKAGSATRPVTHLDWSAKTSRSGNEEGLLSIALDPGYATNRALYLYYSRSAGSRATVLSRFTTSGSGADLQVDPASELVILTVPQPYANHNGGTIAFGPDGMLYLGLGDGGSAGDPQGNGQDLTRNLLGSIVRIDVRQATVAEPYGIPADNPFAGGAGGARPETWAYGLRNPWRMSFDRAEPYGLWVGDVGQNAYEEVDLIERGGNYGWNTMEGAQCYLPRQGCSRAGLVAPKAEYALGGGPCSVTGGYVYRGDAIPALRGTYLYSDYCSGALFGLRDPYGSATPAVTTLIAGGPGVVSFAEDLEGELYALGSDGRIYAVVAN